MLLDSLNIAAKSMNASSVAIQVAGQNLSNASTPGYVREQVLLGTSYPKNSHGYALGTGVDVGGVVQMLDKYLEERLRTSQSDAMNTSTQSGAYSKLEFILNELSDQDLSTELDAFFNSIGNILNQPESISVRQMTVDGAGKLTELIRATSGTILKTRMDMNSAIVDLASEINRLTQEISNLNTGIARIEAGQRPGVEAVGLRDQRLQALSDLSALVNIKTSEDATGVVTIYCGGDMLVSAQGAKTLTVGYNSDPYNQLSLAEIRYSSNNAPLDVFSGKLNGLYEGRDAILGSFVEQLDEFAANLIKEFNAIYSSGQGLTGYDQITSLTVVQDTDVALDKLGLFVQPNSGVFSILVENKATKVTSTTEIQVQLSDTTTNPMTLEDIVKAINNVEGVTARINTNNQLEITSDSPEIQFAFSGDTSGVLSAMGINTFFTGTDSRTIGINNVVKNDPGKFAVSKGGIGADTDNGVDLAAMPETRQSKYGNQSITESYRLMVTTTMSKAGTVKAVATGDVTYYSSLSAQRNSISGVNIDEETISLFNYQRMYQASAKYVTVLNTMLDALIRM
ncbi:MAG: flagellar hook-associated protein FlgK [Thermoguttaceae bacterium]